MPHAQHRTHQCPHPRYIAWQPRNLKNNKFVCFSLPSPKQAIPAAATRSSALTPQPSSCYGSTKQPTSVTTEAGASICVTRMSTKQAHSQNQTPCGYVTPLQASSLRVQPNVPAARDSAAANNTLRSTHVKRRPCCSKEPTSQAADREREKSTSSHMASGGVNCKGGGMSCGPATLGSHGVSRGA